MQVEITNAEAYLITEALYKHQEDMGLASQTDAVDVTLPSGEVVSITKYDFMRLRDRLREHRIIEEEKPLNES